MISQRELFASLYGALRLARADTGGMRYFNATFDGFWNSFTAAALVAPLFALLLWIRYVSDGLTVSLLRFGLIEVFSYIIAWTVFPLIMFYVAQLIERERQFIGFVVAYNWASVWQNFVYLPIAMVGELGWVPLQAASSLSLVVLAGVLLYTWFIARTALAISTMIAAGIVAGDFLISIVLNVVTDGMLRVGR